MFAPCGWRVVSVQSDDLFEVAFLLALLCRDTVFSPLVILFSPVAHLYCFADFQGLLLLG